VDDELMSTYRLHVLSNGFLWQMSACGCCLYFALQASSNWSLMFLQKGRGFSSSAAVTCYFMQFAGSVVGSLICDPIYQSLSKRSHGDDSQAAERLSTAISISSSGMMEKDESLGMNRARVLMSMACVLLAVVALVGLWTVPTVAAGQKTGTVPLSWATLSLFLFGASVFIPKIIFGVAVRESLPPAASGAGGGVLELLSETGAAMSGFPIGLLLDRPGADGWLLMFVLLLASCLTMLLLMTPLLFSGHASKA
jgi:sugar phosphate permease